MLFVSWAPDLDVCSPRYSEIKPLSPKGLYHFVCDADPLVVSTCGDVEINVFFTPKAHCKCIMVTLMKTMHGQDIRDESGHFRVKLDFTTKEHFSIQEGRHVFLSVTLIELEIYKQDEFVRNFLESEGHKIVSQIKIKRRLDMMNIRTIYIGRPQEITTTCYAKSRRYIWKSNDTETSGFLGVGLRSQEDLKDIQRIQKFQVVSPRAEKGEYMHDNDGFSNPNRALPIEFEAGEAITIQMFNLKFDPPKFVEVQVRSAEFSGNTKQYNVVYDGSLHFEFEYHLNRNKIVITAIKMRVNPYITTLNNFGEGKAAKTV